MKPPLLHSWRIEESAFGQTIVTGLDSSGARHTLALLWWCDGRFGTDAGVFRQGFECHQSNFALGR